MTKPHIVLSTVDDDMMNDDGLTKRQMITTNSKQNLQNRNPEKTEKLTEIGQNCRYRSKKEYTNRWPSV